VGSEADQHLRLYGVIEHSVTYDIGRKSRGAEEARVIPDLEHRVLA
jgi:hypothetical protein